MGLDRAPNEILTFIFPPLEVKPPIVSLYHGIMGGNLHGGDASSSHLPLSGSFLGGFSERDIRFGGTNVYVGTNFCRWWYENQSLVTCTPSLQCQQLRHQAWSPESHFSLQQLREVCSGRWGCWKRKDVFTSISSLLLIILCPAVTLLMSTRVQSGSNEVSFLSKYNNIVCKDTADQIDRTSFDKAKENLLVSKFMWSNSTPIFPFTSPRHSYRNLIEAVMKVALKHFLECKVSAFVDSGENFTLQALLVF